MSWADLKVLLAGCGSVGRRHARILSSLGVSHLKICDPIAAQREALSRETPVEEIYSDYHEALKSGPDIVFVLTPPPLHVQMSVKALRAGCHVFCEKPLADDMNNIQTLVETIEQSGKKFMVGFCFRYHEGLRRAKQYLDSGRIGRLVSIRSVMGEHLPTVRPDYRTLTASQHLGVFDLVHEIDLAVWFSGGETKTVKSIHGKISDLDIQVTDVAEVLIEFDNNCYASVHLDFFQRPRRRLTELIGTEGVIEVEFAGWNQCTVSTFTAENGVWTRETLPTERDDMFRNEDRDFLTAVVEDLPVSIPVGEGIKSLRIVALARRQ
ncbi:MAG: Gfo/Idh/MocA family oxidoreductase [Firmicutes bacterium]|nr:Gfo/Idh/MocA family oxidoreductase [Bacillota bacterium]